MEKTRKYLVIDQAEYGDEFVEAYDTLAEANTAAQYQWSCLTWREKETRHIYVVHVENSSDYLNEWAFGDGTVDYTAFHSADTGSGYFDSGMAEE